MCLILFAHAAHPEYSLVLAANRDEFYDRPTAPAGWWPDAPHVLGGRDLRAGGTWLAVSRAGRFAAVTNVRDPARQRTGGPSRGGLVREFVAGDAPPETFLTALLPGADEYDGFNLLLGDGGSLYWYSNRIGEPQQLAPGVYGLSNERLDTPWPKVATGTRALREALAAADAEIEPATLLEILADAEPAEDDLLPNTGVGLELERVLSARFIVSPLYGTRSSSVLLLGRDGGGVFVERSYPRGPATWQDLHFEFGR